MKQKITSLTGLRFVFVIFLFLHHLDMFYDLSIEGYDGLMSYFVEGAVSVNFFFILSGFVISYAYLSKMNNKEISSRTFIAYRLCKLYPVYLITWIGAIFLYSGKAYLLQNIFSKHFIVGLCMLQSYIPLNDYAFWGNGAAWSVSTELFFYVAFIWLVRLTKREQAQICICILGIILLNSFAVGNNSPAGRWFYYINPGVRLLEFMAGMLMYQWWINSSFRPKDVKSATILEVVSASVLIFSMVISIHSPEINAMRNAQLQGIYYLLPCAFLVYAFSFNMGALSKVLSTKLLQFLGNCSFSFYLAHQIVLYIVKMIWGSYIIDIKSMLIYGGIGFVISTIIAVLLHYLVEIPADHCLRANWNKRQNRCKENHNL